MSERVRNAAFASKIMSAEDAAAQIRPGDRVGMSGFTGAGYPKVVPGALAKRIKAAHDAGQEFTIDLFTGASTAPRTGRRSGRGRRHRLPYAYQSDPIMRAKINEGTIDYSDIHLSHLAQRVWEGGVFDTLDVAVVEVTEVLPPDGQVVPASSVGNNKSWLDLADKVILEVNAWQSQELLGMHDIYYGTALPPNRRPVMINRPQDRIGQTTYNVDPAKVIAVVETDAPDRNSEFKAPDEASIAIANHLLDFLVHQVERGRLPKSLLPLQSGVGNVANAVLIGLVDSPLRTPHLLHRGDPGRHGRPDRIRQTRLRLGHGVLPVPPKMAEEMNRRAAYFREKIMLRPQEISNHPRGDPSPRPGRLQRHDRGRHLRQRELHPRLWYPGDERHRRLRRLRPQRVRLRLRHPVHRQERRDLLHRPVRLAHRSHRARHRDDHHRTGPGRHPRPEPPQAGRGDHRQVRPPPTTRNRCASTSSTPRRSTPAGCTPPHDLAQAFSWHLRLAETGTMQPS